MNFWAVSFAIPPIVFENRFDVEDFGIIFVA